ncbi:MAG: hypothetical protein HYZ40_03390 [Rhodospirillales bacterium]|nr:hypothetical protein [Rhodospirillales bacterium]
MKRTLLTLALITAAGGAYAQPMPSSESLDPNGRPFVGRNDWVRQPGDQPGNAGVGGSASTDMATAPSGPREATFKDEFGFRYDAQGNRLDARGNIISPQTR